MIFEGMGLLEITKREIILHLAIIVQRFGLELYLGIDEAEERKLF